MTQSTFVTVLNPDELANVVVTPNAQALVSRADLVNAIGHHFRARPEPRHSSHRIRGSNSNLVLGCRLLSIHRTSQKQRFLLITEADHSRTLVLLPGEFAKATH